MDTIHPILKILRDLLFSGNGVMLGLEEATGLDVIASDPVSALDEI